MICLDSDGNWHSRYWTVDTVGQGRFSPAIHSKPSLDASRFFSAFDKDSTADRRWLASQLRQCQQSIRSESASRSHSANPSYGSNVSGTSDNHWRMMVFQFHPVRPMVMPRASNGNGRIVRFQDGHTTFVVVTANGRDAQPIVHHNGLPVSTCSSMSKHSSRSVRVAERNRSASPVGHRVREQAVRQGETFAYAHHVPSVAFEYRPPAPVLMRGGGEPDSHSASFQVRLLSKTRCRWVSSESRYANW